MVSLLLAFPVLYAIWGSLFDTEFLGGTQEFVGLKHYVDLFQDPDFLWAILRSLIFVSGCLILGTSLALVFAFALNKAAGWLRFARGVTIVPYLVSGVATAVMFRLLFNKEFGQVNRTFEFFGIEGPSWFSDPVLAMVATIIAQVWSDLPLAVLLLLGGLQTIDPSLLDAAEVDGASPVRTLWSIVLPLSRPILGVVSILSIVTAWKDFVWPLVVLPDPGKQTISVALQRVAPDIPTNYLLAGLVLASIPMIVAFVIFQRQILAGLTAGSLKG